MGGLLTTGAMVGLKEFGKVNRMLKEWQPSAAEEQGAPVAS